MIGGSVTEQETVESKLLRGDDAWDPDWITYGFTAWAQCQHPKCKQQFAIAGTGGVGLEPDEEGRAEWEDYFEIRYCFPAPRMIAIPDKCPKEVNIELDAAFALYWSQPAASAGRLRVALELLLNHQGVKKRKRDGGKNKDLSLHARLELFAQSNPATAAQLMALKSLGNSGAHEGSISKGDLLDAFEVLEHALGEIIEQRSKRVALLAKQLTQKHSRKR